MQDPNPHLMSATRAFFAAGGPLARVLPTCEARPAQLAVAEAVAESLAAGSTLLAEAGTGTGKTLAYLVPALHSGLQVVVSTGTKNLQDQLVDHDVPLLRRALGRRLAVEVMKGRSNYLCELRADRALAQGTLPQMPGAEMLPRLQQWRARTHTGDRAELAGLADEAPLWRELSATREQCLGRACSQYDRCWVVQMRRRAQSADLVVVNHHLYLADAALRQTQASEAHALIPGHDVVIFDEAHELGEAAAQHFGHQVSERQIAELGDDIARAAAGHGTLGARLAPTLAALRPMGLALFDALPLGAGRMRLRDGFLSDVAAGHLRQLDGQLQRLEAELGSGEDEELRLLARRAATLSARLAFTLDVPARESLVEASEFTHEDEGALYMRYGERQSRHRSVAARPIDVAPLLGGLLRARCALFVSATLQVGGSFDHFRRDVGLGACRELAVDSPFDYAAQTCLFLPTHLPEPEAPAFTLAAASCAADLVAASQGGAFVLCTSHRALPAMAQAVRQAHAGPVLLQGTAPKAHLLRAFAARQDSVLVATLSFWKGVDVPGSALRLVIMDKIPFASPADPWVEARLEYLAARGAEPFVRYQVPQAALLLRQGFGRLIRRHTDRGMVAILDRRLVGRRYGPLLLRNLPRCPRLHHLDEAVSVLRRGRPAPDILASPTASPAPS